MITERSGIYSEISITYRIEPKRIFELIDVLVGTWKMAKRDLEKFLVFLERVE